MPSRRSNLYRALAESLAMPYGSPPDWLALPGPDWPLFRAAASLAEESQAARSAVAALARIGPEPAETRRERWVALFSGSSKLSTGVYESGAREGRLPGASTFAVERWYREAGLEITGAELPDHASLELEFLAFLAETGLPEWTAIERAFLDQHAGRWLPGLGRALAASSDPVYAPVGRLLAVWVEEACLDLGVPGFQPAAAKQPLHAAPRPAPLAASRLPGVPRPEDCTLCSFCVAACRSGALAIVENDRSTSLTLSPERCTGCGRCARACQAGVLLMDRSSVQGRQVLRQSPRAVCRSCGALMVSQAELDYVAACLDHPAWLDFCPDCRGA